MIPLIGLTLISFTGCTQEGTDSTTNNTGVNSPVATPYVQDLIGVKGRDGGGSLKERGFVWVKTKKLDDSSYTYWRHNQSGQCLSVRTTNGRYVALRKKPSFDCAKE